MLLPLYAAPDFNYFFAISLPFIVIGQFISAALCVVQRTESLLIPLIMLHACCLVFASHLFFWILAWLIASNPKKSELTGLVFLSYMIKERRHCLWDLVSLSVTAGVGAVPFAIWLTLELDFLVCQST